MTARGRPGAVVREEPCGRPFVHRSEADPEGGGSWTARGGGPGIAVLVSLDFPDLTPPVAGLVRRFTGTALETDRKSVV